MPSKNLHLLMTANATQQIQELQKVNNQLGELRTKTSGVKGAFDSMAGIATPGQFLRGGLLNAVGAIPKIGPGLQSGLVAVEAFNEKMNEVSERTIATGRASMIAGVGFEKFQTMMKAGGVDADMLQRSLVKFRVSVEDAANGNEELANTFRSLGLEPMVLVAQRTDDAFMDLARAFQQHENVGHRVADMHKILGRSFQDLLPLLTKTKSELEIIRARSEKTGAIVSEDDLKLLERAEIQTKALEEVSTGASNRMAAAWSHVKTAFSFLSTYLLTDKSMRQIADETIDKEKSIAIQRKILAEKNSADLVKKLHDQKMAELDEIAKYWAKRHQLEQNELNKLGQEAMTNGEKFFREMDDLQERLRNQDLSPKQREDITNVMAKKRQEFAAGIEGAIGPLDNFYLRLAKLDDAQKSGGLSAEQYARALGALADSASIANSEIAPLNLERGTQAEYQFTYQAQHADTRDIQQRMLDTLNQLKALQDKATKDGEAVKDIKKVIDRMAKQLGIAK